MGELRNPRAWGELRREVSAALAERVLQEEFHLGHSVWFADGRSGEPVAGVVRVPPGHSGAEQLVLKFFASDGEKRIINLQRAWGGSGRFQPHLAQPEVPPMVLGEWRAVFMRIAGGDLERVVALSNANNMRDFPDHCAAIVRSVVDDWNGSGYAATPNPSTVGEILGDVVKRRRADMLRWAQDTGIPIDGSATSVQLNGWPEVEVNPFALLFGNEAARTVDHLLIGRAHGDLSGRNILLPVNRRSSPANSS